MAGIKWDEFRRKRLHEVWEALPEGHRLHVAIYHPEAVWFSAALAEANMLAYYNRIALKIWQEGADVFCVVSQTDGAEARRMYKVDCWNF